MKNVIQFSLAIAVCTMMMACKTNKQYNSAVNDATNSGYNNGYTDGSANTQSNMTKVTNLSLMVEAEVGGGGTTITFVKLAQDDSNYAVLDAFDGTTHTYYAFYIPSYVTGETYAQYGQNPSTKAYGNLTANGDGTFSCVSCIYATGGTTPTNVTTTSSMVFEKTSVSPKDLQKAAALAEAFKVDQMSSSIAAQFGLSKDRSVVVAKMATAWNKLAKTRAVTDADADAFTKQLTGVSMSDMSKAEDAMRVGNMSPLNDVLSKAAAVNGTTSENMAAIMNQLFIQN